MAMAPEIKVCPSRPCLRPAWRACNAMSALDFFLPRASLGLIALYWSAPGCEGPEWRLFQLV